MIALIYSSVHDVKLDTGHKSQASQETGHIGKKRKVTTGKDSTAHALDRDEAPLGQGGVGAPTGSGDAVTQSSGHQPLDFRKFCHWLCYGSTIQSHGNAAERDMSASQRCWEAVCAAPNPRCISLHDVMEGVNKEVDAELVGSFGHTVLDIARAHRCLLYLDGHEVFDTASRDGMLAKLLDAKAFKQRWLDVVAQQL